MPSWSFWLWLAITLLTLLIIIVIGIAYSVKHAMVGDGRLTHSQNRIVIALADFPGLAHKAALEMRSRLRGGQMPLLMDRNSVEKPYWVRRFPAPEDTGYLLLSGVDSAAKKPTVRLIRIADGAVVAHWDPDWKNIYDKISEKRDAPKGSLLNLTANHPILLKNGDIIFNTSNSLVRLNSCDSKPVWVLDEVMHHSNELDETGDATWIPSVSQDGLADNAYLQNLISDNSLAHVSIDGHFIENRSFIHILRDNGLQSILFGMFGHRINEDPIHLNEIQVAQRNTKYWHLGDLLISSRHLSTIFLYRPSSNKIIWYQTGPWINQHSVDFIDDHRISVFNNNNILSLPKEHAFMSPRDTNNVIVYDFDTKQTTYPFSDLLAKARPRTTGEGRARILPDGGLFIEETQMGRHLRFTKDQLLWSRVNDYDEQRIGLVSWSRYLTAEEADIPLKALALHRCKAGK